MTWKNSNRVAFARECQNFVADSVGGEMNINGETRLVTAIGDKQFQRPARGVIPTYVAPRTGPRTRSARVPLNLHLINLSSSHGQLHY